LRCIYTGCQPSRSEIPATVAWPN